MSLNLKTRNFKPETRNFIFIFILYTALLFISCSSFNLAGTGSGSNPQANVTESKPKNPRYLSADSMKIRQYDYLEKQVVELKKELGEIKATLYQVRNALEDLKRQNIVSSPSLETSIADTTETTDKIILRNNTVIAGVITHETLDEYVVMTSIGSLNVRKSLVKDILREKKHAECVLEGKIEETPDGKGNLVLSGWVKNVGNRRGDFVQIELQFRDQTTEIIGIEQIFVNGTRTLYSTNVISDTAIEPFEKASFRFVLPPDKYPTRQYFTYVIVWHEYD